MRIPRVAIITPGTFPIPSGSSSSVERVVEHVVSLSQSSMKAVIYSRRWPGQSSYGYVGDVPCVRVSSSGGRAYVKQVIRQLRSYKPDIIQIENRPRFVRMLQRAFPHARIWLSLHSLTFISSKYVPRHVLVGMLQKVERIWVNSHYLYRQVAALAPSCAARMVINPLGVDIKRFKSRWSLEGAAAHVEGKRLNGWEHKQIVMYVGRLIPLKGVHYFLQAIPQLVEKHPNTMFVVVGSAFYGSTRKTKYVRKLEQWGSRYPHHVRFIPYVQHEDVPKWYAMADVVVVPSVDKEAFGLVNVEAMATGVPIVASRAGGIQEVILNEETGILVSPTQLKLQLGSAITRLLENAGLRERLGRAGVRRVEQFFTWEHTAERWMNEVRASDSGTPARI
ncbi:glycosyltransferase [Paenibacillus arenosi]|uniref:Glycosyltransferase family 4 protein n=1 Tax=Paenibacillus arenosi TaxID=2774142 RepID=A0ABR9B1J3_9BACL|nr:glycosyltransferase family 4 protein [Paenibacillus arenosi]